MRIEVGKERGKRWALVSTIEVYLFSCCANKLAQRCSLRQ
jgi:hypothetical protein